MSIDSANKDGLKNRGGAWAGEREMPGRDLNPLVLNEGSNYLIRPFGPSYYLDYYIL
ncbi:MAG: hypothetical protein JW860_02950 [Sedimentisphaerales bacterium]|nr:hypothetical protein [Sedimentisphaerales bacterium]